MKQTGKSAQTHPNAVRPTKVALRLNKVVDSTKPIGRGGGKNRGDRVDTSPVFTTDRKKIKSVTNPHSRGRKQIQGGGKARRGGGKKSKGSYHQPLMEY